VSAFGLIFLVLGVGLLVGCFFAVTRTKRFLANAHEAQAEVIALQHRVGTHHERSYYPVLRYRTQQGTTQEVVSNVGTNPPRYKEGDSVVVLYDPAQPDNVRIHTFFNVWVFPLVLGALGVIFLCVGGGIAMFSGR
jgi:hypothetical protein